MLGSDTMLVKTKTSSTLCNQNQINGLFAVHLQQNLQKEPIASIFWPIFMDSTSICKRFLDTL